MSSDKSGNLGVPDVEQLTAYLDGELPPEDARHVERRLSQEDLYRRELQGLDDAWHALDELPSETVGDDFAKTTVELIAVSVEEELARETAALPVIRRKQSWLLGLACLAAAGVGFAAARFPGLDPHYELLRDLPIIEHLDGYTQFQELAFLERLRREIGVERLADDAVRLAADTQEFQVVCSASLPQRRTRIEESTLEQKSALMTRATRYGNLPANQRRELRDLHDQVVGGEHAAELQEVLIAYGQWLQQLSDGEQAELRSLDPAARIEQIGRLLRRQPSAADAAALRREIQRLFRERVEGGVDRSRLDEDLTHRGPNGQIPRTIQQRRRQTFARLLASSALNRNPRIQEHLLSVLSDQGRQKFEGLDREEIADTLRNWIRTAFRTEQEPADLEEIFSTQLTNEQREQLLAMPRDQMLREIESHLARQQNLDWDRELPPEWHGPPPKWGDRQGGPPRRAFENDMRGRRGPASRGPFPRQPREETLKRDRDELRRPLREPPPPDEVAPI